LSRPLRPTEPCYPFFSCVDSTPPIGPSLEDQFLSFVSPPTKGLSYWGSSITQPCGPVIFFFFCLEVSAPLTPFPPQRPCHRVLEPFSQSDFPPQFGSFSCSPVFFFFYPEFFHNSASPRPLTWLYLGTFETSSPPPPPVSFPPFPVS